MAPLPENNTARLWVDYNDGVNDHTIMMRYADTVLDEPDAVLSMVGFFEAAASMLYVVTIGGVRFSAMGSNVSIPLVWSGDATYGDSVMPLALAPRETRWLGRDQNGRRVSWSLYGGKYTTPDEYRLLGATTPAVQDVLDYLTSQDTTGNFLTIQGHKPLRYPYADVNFNSYWEQEARS